MLPVALVGFFLLPGLAALGAVRASDDVYLASSRLARLGRRSLGRGQQSCTLAPGSTPCSTWTPAAPTYNLTLLHVNDIHSHLDQYTASGADCPEDGSQPCLGGYARIIDEVARVRANNGDVPVLLLNAGDEFQGSLFFSFYGPTKIAETLNLLHFDAFTIGNHEFDRSDGVLAEFLGSLNAPAVSTNIKTTHPALAAQLVPFLVLPEHSLGIVALTTVDTPEISQPSNLTHFEPVINVQGTVDKLLDGRLGGKDASGTPLVKRVIALTHIGYEQDQLLAQSTRGISLIVGGHSHTPLGGEAWYSQGPYPTLRTNLDGEEVPIVTSYRWGEHLGRIDVAFEADSGRFNSYTGGVMRMTDEYSQDEAYQAKVDKWRKPFDKFARKVIGRTTYDLDQSRCKDGECTMGDMTADAFLWARQSIGARVDAAMHNSGGIRNGVSAPNITMGSIATAFPFTPGELVDIVLTGSELWDIIEGTVSKVNIKGKIVTAGLQIAGMRYTYNPKNEKGSRLISLQIGPDLEDIVMDRSYTIVTVDFVATGGDSILPNPFKVAPPGVASQVDSIVSYVKHFSPLTYELDGRIKVTSETKPQRPKSEWNLEQMVSLAAGEQSVRLVPDDAVSGWGGWAEWVRERQRRLGRWQ